MTGEDAWALVAAIMGTTDHGIDADELYRSGVVAMIDALREERDHLVNQLAAAEKHVEVMATRKNYVASPWLHHDVQTLRRLLAAHLPTPLEELQKRKLLGGE